MPYTFASDLEDILMLPEENVVLPEIKIEGRSGCRIEVLKSGEHVIIKKYSNSLAYNKRLIEQVNKQQSFYNNLPYSFRFSTAKVIDSYTADTELAWFTMPYLFSEKYSDYLEKATIVDLKVLLHEIKEYIRFNIARAEFVIVDKNIIASKIDELGGKIEASDLIERKHFFFKVLQQLLPALPSEPLPVGLCHGDLTFSNILFGDHQIFLLDFLDSFIESPIIDLVKLRQDTCFKWSIMLEKQLPVYKKNKLVQTFNYLDKELALFCDTELQMDKWYQYLQLFNLLRIVPYLTDRDEISFVEKCLQQLGK